MRGFRIVHRVQGDERVQGALDRFPRVMKRHLDLGASRAAQEVAREMRKEAPKAFSTLVNSIKADRLRPMRYEIGPHVEYGVYVDEGTGPGGSPPQLALEDWIRIKRITPRTPGVTQEDLVFLIGRKIRERGVEAQPYVQPTAERMEPRVHALIRQAAERGLRELKL